MLSKYLLRHDQDWFYAGLVYAVIFSAMALD